MEISRHSHKLPETFTHAHARTYELMYCICGSYVFHYERADHTIVDGIVRTPKTMIFIPPNVPHGIHVLEYPYERYFIQLSSRTAEEILDRSIMASIFSGDGLEEQADEAGEPCFWNVESSAERIEPLLEQMYDIQFSPHLDEHWKRTNLNSLFGLLMCELYRNHRNFFAQSLVEYTQPVRRAKNFIDEHYDQPITLRDIARECFLSPNYLSKCFRSQIGMSPRQYLTQMRLSTAQKLLCSTQLPIQTIAMRAGFSDVNYFISHFKESYGATPKQYRKTVEEGILD